MISNNMNLEEISILFVATSAASKRLEPIIDGEGIDGLKENLTNCGCPPETFEFILQNDLIFYEYDDQKEEFPAIQPRDLPEIYWKYFISEMQTFDLDKYRKKIGRIIKAYFPKVKNVNYTTVDWQILSPSYCNTMDKVVENDLKFSKITGLTFTFKQHYKCTFQNLIRNQQSKYNIIWFLGCCTPSYFISKKVNYISNFKNSLCINGLIFHMDPVVGSTLDFIDMERRQEKVGPEELIKVRHLTKKLIKIKNGIYRFS